MLADCIESLESRRLFSALYTLNFLPPVTGAGLSNANAINNSGVIVGFNYNIVSPSNNIASSRWSGANGSTVAALPTLGAEHPIDINDAGTILYANHKYAGGKLTKLPLSSAIAINNLGDIAGYANGDSVILRSDGSMVKLAARDPSPGSTTDLNDYGEVTGQLFDQTLSNPKIPLYYATIYREHETELLQLPIDFGAANQGPDTIANAINNIGIAVGTVHTRTSSQQAVLWRPGGEMKELGAIAGVAKVSQALDINDAGDVVGTAGSGAYADAFIYTGGAMRDLNTLVTLPPGMPWVHLVQALHINNTGQIVGGGWGPSGYYSAFLLTPIRNCTISGSIFNDADADVVKDTGEAGISGRKVFLDVDRDGVLDAGEKTTTTDAAGNYKFTGLAPGTYGVHDVPVAGWRRTAPSAGYYTVTTTAGQTVSARNFAYTRNVLISGSIFNDADGDRVRDSGEAGLSGWRIFVDRDNDGVFDAGENSVLSDSAGNWRFRQLPAGTYTIRVVRPAGWTQTTPTSGAFMRTLAAGGASGDNRFGFRHA